MKRWAKILLVIGIIWIILISIYTVYACVHIMEDVICKNPNGCPVTGGCDWFIPFLILGIPSWIMFVVVAIWGRGKK